MDDVSIGMDWPPGLPFKLTTEDCQKYLISTLVDACDGNDPRMPRTIRQEDQ